MSENISKKRDPLLLRVEEVAERLGISVRTVWRLVSSKQLCKPVSIGRCKRWRAAEVEQFVETLASR